MPRYILQSMFWVTLTLSIVGCGLVSPAQEQRDVDLARSYWNHFVPSYDLSHEEMRDELDHTRYTREDEVIYYGGEVVSWADSISFIPIGGSYGIDNNALYVNTVRYPVNVETLKIYRDYGYVSFDDRVYWLGENSLQELLWADVSTFEQLSFMSDNGMMAYSGLYGKDKDDIYYLSNVLYWVDYDSFQLLDYGTAQDIHYVYINGKKQN